jgi:type II secretory pathway component PulF
MAIELDIGRATATPLPRMSRGRIGAQALAQATRQLAVMLGAGLPVVSGLRLLAEQADRSRLRLPYPAQGR